jgi:hypothetical protein
MNTFLRTFVVLASFALSSALFANLSASLGSIGSGDTLNIAFETYSDNGFAIIDENTNQEVAYVSILYNGWWYPSQPFYGSSGNSNVTGVSVTGAEYGNVYITGLPAGDYRLQTYTNSPSISQYASPTYTFEELTHGWYYDYLSCYISIY